MNRRRRLLLAAGALAAAPLGVRAQPPRKSVRIGVLTGGVAGNSANAERFRARLRELGYEEGRNLAIEWRSAGGDVSRIPAIAEELVDRAPDVLANITGLTAQSGQQAAAASQGDRSCGCSSWRRRARANSRALSRDEKGERGRAFLFSQCDAVRAARENRGAGAPQPPSHDLRGAGIFTISALVVSPCFRAIAQGKVYRLGVLSAGNREATRYLFDAFEKGMRNLKYVAGQNLNIEYRFAEGNFDRLPALAAELVRLKPDAMLVHTTPGNLAAKKATAEIPIVMVGVADPVGVGLVPNLSRPGGNITGITNITAALAGKRLELLKELLHRLGGHYRFAAALGTGCAAQGIARGGLDRGPQPRARIAFLGRWLRPAGRARRGAG